MVERRWDADGGPSVIATAARYAAGLADPEREAEIRLSAGLGYASLFTLQTPARAAAEATASAKRWREGRPSGFLDGVPLVWKDMIDLLGEVTTVGSRVIGRVPAIADAALVRRLTAAGAVTLGRVNMTELAFSGLGLNPHYGTPANPHGRDEPRVPGGSSSGSAVAVAAGIVAVAIGTDTGGSVRVPAAFNGIVGYKTSGGRWPMAGVFPLSHSLDTLGVFARTVLDAAIVDAAARDLAAPDLRRGTLDGLRLVVPTTIVLDDLEPEVAANFEAALGRLARAGVAIERRAMPAFAEIARVNAEHGVLHAYEGYQLHRELIASEAAAKMDRRVVARLKGSAGVGSEDERILRATRARLIADASALFDGHTLVACPTVAHVAPKIASLEADDALFARVNAKTLRNTLFGNMLDWCGVSVPNGTGEAGMPTGFLLSGGPGRDDHLLATALAAEAVIRGAA